MGILGVSSALTFNNELVKATRTHKTGGFFGQDGGSLETLYFGAIDKDREIYAAFATEARFSCLPDSVPRYTFGFFKLCSGSIRQGITVEQVDAASKLHTELMELYADTEEGKKNLSQNKQFIESDGDKITVYIGDNKHGTSVVGEVGQWYLPENESMLINCGKGQASVCTILGILRRESEAGEENYLMVDISKSPQIKGVTAGYSGLLANCVLVCDLGSGNLEAVKDVNVCHELINSWNIATEVGV